MKDKIRKALSVLISFVMVAAGFMSPSIFTITVKAAGGGETFISVPENGFSSANTGAASNKTVRISGDAALNGKGGVAIVSNSKNKAGGVFFTQPIQQGTGFSTSFKIHMGASQTGTADGFAFIIANATNQVGSNGKGIGYNGITKSIAIEYDTYDNKSGGSKGDVPHIWYGNNGNMDTSDNNRSVLFEKSGNKSSKQNAVNYHVYGWAEFNAAEEILKVTFSSSPIRPAHPTIILQYGQSNSTVMNANGTMVITNTNFKPGNPSSPFYIGNQYYMGFTAATGGYCQEVTLQAFSAYGEYVASSGGNKTVTINGEIVEVGSGLDLPKITPIPPPPGTDGTFQGLYDAPNGEGTQYYDENGNGVHANDLDDGAELYPYFSYNIKLKGQGVADSVMSVSDGQQLPATVTIPVRDGYIFAGYYDDIVSGAVCYYDDGGDRQNNDVWYASVGPNTLYAKWTKADAAVTVALDSGEWENPPSGFSGSGDSYSANLAGGTVVTLPVPTRSGYLFAGWTVTGTGGYIWANGKTFTSVGGAVALTARWTQPSTGFDDRTDDKDVDGDVNNLTRAFESENLAADPEKGITAAELLTGNVSLRLCIDDIVGETTGAAAIKSQAAKIGGLSASGNTKFYDIFVEKDVDGDVMRLKEIPETVTAQIPIKDSLLGATSYTVFHYHDDEVRIIYDDSTAEEYWEISDDGSYILIHVRKFSDFGILANGRTIGPVVQNELAAEPMNGNNNPGMDVQGKVSERGREKRYKLDVAWGAMKFEYSVGNEWNPDTHDYSGSKINEWIPTVDTECYTNGNNMITTYNHSNDGVELTFTSGSVESYLDGVDIKILQSNTDIGAPADNVPLERVAVAGDPIAPSVDVFVRLVGSPSDVESFLQVQSTAGDGVWNKVAVITLTIIPKNGEITPIS